MSFFGFDTSLGKLQDPTANRTSADEDLAVYTWGEDSYDGLGNALQEVGDDLNDVTFGTGAVGKDFDFAATSDPLARSERPHSSKAAHPQTHSNTTYPSEKTGADLWANKSTASALPKFIAPNRTNEQTHQQKRPSTSSPSVFARLDGSSNKAEHVQRSPAQIYASNGATGAPDLRGVHARSLAEIEAEMQAAARLQQQQQLMQLQQQELERTQQEMLRQQQQRLQQEEILRAEQDQLRQIEQRALKDPVWLLQQQLMEQEAKEQQQLLQQQASHVYPSNPAFPSRPSMSIPQSGTPNQPGMIDRQHLLLQEMLLQQQQQQYLNQQQQFQLNPEQKEAMMADAHRRIQEAEVMEAKRRKRLAKIASMSRYNDLMTQSDKDFITRVQVAQLVTSNPYADDFYAQVYASVRSQRHAAEANVLKAGNTGGSAPGPTNNRGPHRRENALQRMQAQVERLVNNAKNRELSKEAGPAQAALQNVLGKTSGRSYKAAPRQLLQVAITTPELPKAHTNKDSDADRIHETHNGEAQVELPPPFSRSESLLIIERLFGKILDIEQLRRDKPTDNTPESLNAWNENVQRLLGEIWDGLRIWGPLYETNPHPFIALIMPLKGKRFIGRLGRDLTDDQKLTALSVIVNRIEQLDVIQNAAIMDSIEDSRERRLAEKQAYAFQELVINQGLHLSPGSRNPKTYHALIEMMMENPSTFARVVKTRSGLALLETFFAEAAMFKHGITTAEGETVLPSVEDLKNWETIYDRLFDRLLPLWVDVFPSTRVLVRFPVESVEYLQAGLVTDSFDQHVWRFLAGFALEGTQEQHSKLVTHLRTKVMSDLRAAHRLEEGKAKARKIRNIDLFLNALGLSSSQIPLH